MAAAVHVRLDSPVLLGPHFAFIVAMARCFAAESLPIKACIVCKSAGDSAGS